ncbi:propionyl-CoA synthetase [Sesbania bispinosa]|nr:propionyl-CoA synthetase [Sesbania bispinosa]
MGLKLLKKECLARVRIASRTIGMTKRRQNFNRQNKKPDTREGSLFRAYIKTVIEAEEAAAYKMKKSISDIEVKMLRGCDEHLAHLFLEINRLTYESYYHEVGAGRCEEGGDGYDRSGKCKVLNSMAM